MECLYHYFSQLLSVHHIFIEVGYLESTVKDLPWSFYERSTISNDRQTVYQNVY